MNNPGDIPAERLPVIVDALRTPFLNSGGAYTELRNYELAAVALRAIHERGDIDPRAVESVALGCVVQDVNTTNVAREAMLAAGYSSRTPAYTVSMAGVSPEASVTTLCDMIALGRIELAVAGGSDNFSDLPIRMARNVRKRAVRLATAKTNTERLKVLAGLRPRDLIPDLPTSQDITTGLTMGMACEAMVQRFGVTREAADRYAAGSHQRAAAAWRQNRFGDDVVPVTTPQGMSVTRDDAVRADTDEQKLARLKPAFDKQAGIITAGNASGLTDGATAVLLTSMAGADKHGLQAQAIVRDYEMTGVTDMATEMLMGPAVAIPRILARNGLGHADIGAYEVHEAFAAQILANQIALADDHYARAEAGVEHAVGEIPADKLNIWGGSVALGNPFAATGGRLLATATRRLRESGARYGVIATCAGGGLGAAMLLENPTVH